MLAGCLCKETVRISRNRSKLYLAYHLSVLLSNRNSEYFSPPSADAIIEMQAILRERGTASNHDFEMVCLSLASLPRYE
jgi:hypothetical protein